MTAPVRSTNFYHSHNTPMIHGGGNRAVYVVPHSHPQHSGDEPQFAEFSPEQASVSQSPQRRQLSHSPQIQEEAPQFETVEVPSSTLQRASSSRSPHSRSMQLGNHLPPDLNQQQHSPQMSSQSQRFPTTNSVVYSPDGAGSPSSFRYHYSPSGRGIQYGSPQREDPSLVYVSTSPLTQTAQQMIRAQVTQFADSNVLDDFTDGVQPNPRLLAYAAVEPAARTRYSSAHVDPAASPEVHKGRNELQASLSRMSQNYFPQHRNFGSISVSDREEERRRLSYFPNDHETLPWGKPTVQEEPRSHYKQMFFPKIVPRQENGKVVCASYGHFEQWLESECHIRVDGFRKATSLGLAAAGILGPGMRDVPETIDPPEQILVISQEKQFAKGHVHYLPKTLVPRFLESEEPENAAKEGSTGSANWSVSTRSHFSFPLQHYQPKIGRVEKRKINGADRRDPNLTTWLQQLLEAFYQEVAPHKLATGAVEKALRIQAEPLVLISGLCKKYQQSDLATANWVARLEEGLQKFVHTKQSCTSTEAVPSSPRRSEGSIQEATNPNVPSPFPWVSAEAFNKYSHRDVCLADRERWFPSALKTVKPHEAQKKSVKITEHTGKSDVSNLGNDNDSQMPHAGLFRAVELLRAHREQGTPLPGNEKLCGMVFPPLKPLPFPPPQQLGRRESTTTVERKGNQWADEGGDLIVAENEYDPWTAGTFVGDRHATEAEELSQRELEAAAAVATTPIIQESERERQLRMSEEARRRNAEGLARYVGNGYYSLSAATQRFHCTKGNSYFSPPAHAAAPDTFIQAQYTTPKEPPRPFGPSSAEIIIAAEAAEQSARMAQKWGSPAQQTRQQSSIFSPNASDRHQENFVPPTRLMHLFGLSAQLMASRQRSSSPIQVNKSSVTQLPMPTRAMSNRVDPSMDPEWGSALAENEYLRDISANVACTQKSEVELYRHC